MAGLSKLQVTKRYGFNFRWIEELIDRGLVTCLPGCTPLRQKISHESIESLVENAHYVKCIGCGMRAGQITTKHVKSCSGISLSEYAARYPGALILCDLASENREKTEVQKQAQSKKLKARFQTPAGEVTRSQIGKSAKRMQASESGDRSKAHLVKLNSDPVRKKQISQETKSRWDSGEAREHVEGWHRDNKEQSNSLIANARSFNRRKRTKLHLGFKELMVSSGILGFQTEYRVGYFSIDEALPGKRLSLEIDGCYWHSCPQCGLKGPSDNRRTDKSKATYLANRGWLVLRLWEHEIKRDPDGCLARVRAFVQSREKLSYA
jgi:DNA mismatch endonuclease (patch repair protein)